MRKITNYRLGQELSKTRPLSYLQQERLLTSQWSLLCCLPRFHCDFQLLPWSTASRNIKWKKLQNKQFTSFKLCDVLSSLMRSRTIPLMNHLLCPAYSLCVNHLAAIWVIRSTVSVLQCLCSSNPYFTYYWPQSTIVVVLEIQICQRHCQVLL